jgi:tetratricopeptide (TPR) repeat protein/tRNA A-37 threonylcarbamoyl transferase component Bud32
MAIIGRKIPPRIAATPRYELGPVLGVGGMGSIHRAYDRVTQKTLAYKRLRVRSESVRARVTALFQREYDTLARLNHPNIISVYDYGFDAEGPYYTMELLSGTDLRKAGELSLRDVCKIMREIASALALLHARRLVHRDISPNNVRLMDDGRAKLLDFGSLTPFGAASEIVGTVPFLAPESLRKQHLDQRTDLYSLGALMYWTLTRQYPVDAQRLEDLPAAWTRPLVRPSSYVPSLPAELDALIVSLLARDAVLRPTSAGAVMERLTNIAELPPESDEATVAYGYLMQPPLIGREAVVAELQRLLEHALSGRGQVAVIEAARGMGRTAILDQLAVDAQLAGATVLRADDVASAPLATARRLIERGLAIFPDQASVLEELVPQPTGPVRSANEATERHERLVQQLARRLIKLSTRSALVLIIDDVQRVDAASLALLSSLRHTLPEHPILLLFSRESGAVSAAGEALEQVLDQSERLQLSYLSEPEVHELVSAVFGAVPNCQIVARWLHAESGGNPAQLMDLARLMLQRGLVQYARGSFVLPHELHTFERTDGSALMARLDGISAAALHIVQLLSVHEGALRADDLVRACALPASEFVQAIDQLGARGVLRSTSAGYELASASLRAAVQHALTREPLEQLHLAIARTLAKRQAEMGAARQASLEGRMELAQHLLYAGAAGELEGAGLIARATSEAAYEVAMMRGSVPLVTRALSVYQRLGYDDEDCAGLLVTLGISGFYGDLETQRAYLDRALTALSRLIGLEIAGRAQRWLGPRAGLLAGMFGAFGRNVVAPAPLYRASTKRMIEVFLNLVGAASAAASSSLNPQEAMRIASFLDPFTALPENSGPCVVREFSIATAESGSGRARTAARRYAGVIELLQKPVSGLNSYSHWQLLSGAIYGRAQSEVTSCSKVALTLADELESKSPFHRPHAYCVRMIYHLFRGEQQLADLCRGRAEEITSRAGTSWSAAIVLAVRTLQASILTGDLVNLVRAIAELGRMIELAPNIAAYHELATAHLDLLREHPERALPIYERVLSSAAGRNLPSYAFDATLMARALSELGEHGRAKALCEQVIDGERQGRWDSEILSRAPRQQLALTEAALGNIETARAILDGQVALAQPLDNPLALGSLARDHARVALLARDRPYFERQFESMSAYYRATENPWLVQQCEALHNQAVQAGLLPREALGGWRSGAAHARRQELLAGETQGQTTFEAATRLIEPTAVSGIQPSRFPKA